MKIENNIATNFLEGRLSRTLTIWSFVNLVNMGLILADIFSLELNIYQKYYLFFSFLILPFIIYQLMIWPYTSFLGRKIFSPKIYDNVSCIYTAESGDYVYGYTLQGRQCMPIKEGMRFLMKAQVKSIENQSYELELDIPEERGYMVNKGFNFKESFTEHANGKLIRANDGNIIVSRNGILVP